MYPVITDFFGYGPSISSFGFMIVVAFLVTGYILKRDFDNYGYNKDYADDIIFRAAFGGILGAKIYYIIENFNNGIGVQQIYGLIDIFKGLFGNFDLLKSGASTFGSGLVFLGGLIGALILITIFIKRKSLDWYVVADFAAPLIALGHGIGRIGCFLVGDDYGTPTNLPWAIKFGEGSMPPSTLANMSEIKFGNTNLEFTKSFEHFTLDIHEVIAVHPTQLYEMIIYFSIFFFLRFLLKKNHFPGEIFINYLFLAGLGRLLVEFIRLNPRYFLDLSGAQIISICMMAAATIGHFYFRKKKIVDGNS